MAHVPFNMLITDAIKVEMEKLWSLIGWNFQTNFFSLLLEQLRLFAAIILVATHTKKKQPFSHQRSNKLLCFKSFDSCCCSTFSLKLPSTLLLSCTMNGTPTKPSKPTSAFVPSHPPSPSPLMASRPSSALVASHPPSPYVDRNGSRGLSHFP